MTCVILVGYLKINTSLCGLLTSCGGTSNDTVLRSTCMYVSIQGSMKNRPVKRNKDIHQHV